MAGLIVVGVIVVIALFIWASAIRILREYERGVVFRLGRLVALKGPGLRFLIPIVDQMVRVDLRTVTLNVPPQEVITKDNVTVRVNADHVIDKFAEHEEGPPWFAGCVSADLVRTAAAGL